jgi:hypothetical protein
VYVHNLSANTVAVFFERFLGWGYGDGYDHLLLQAVLANFENIAALQASRWPLPVPVFSVVVLLVRLELMWFVIRYISFNCHGIASA